MAVIFPSTVFKNYTFTIPETHSRVVFFLDINTKVYSTESIKSDLITTTPAITTKEPKPNQNWHLYTFPKILTTVLTTVKFQVRSYSIHIVVFIVSQNLGFSDREFQNDRRKQMHSNDLNLTSWWNGSLILLITYVCF